MRCYLNKPEATAETSRMVGCATGDLAVMDAEGYVHISGPQEKYYHSPAARISPVWMLRGACTDCPEVRLESLRLFLGACRRKRVGEGVSVPVSSCASGQPSDPSPAGQRRSKDIYIASLKPRTIGDRKPCLLIARVQLSKIDRRGLRTACLENEKGKKKHLTPKPSEEKTGRIISPTEVLRKLQWNVPGLGRQHATAPRSDRVGHSFGARHHVARCIANEILRPQAMTSKSVRERPQEALWTVVLCRGWRRQLGQKKLVRQRRLSAKGSDKRDGPFQGLSVVFGLGSLADLRSG